MNPDAKREAILAAGEALFASHGYTNTSIADIGKAADVAVGTIYRLFPDKPALLAAMHERMENRFINAMRAAWEETAEFEQKLGRICHALMLEAEKTLDVMPLYGMTRDLAGAHNYVPGDRTIADIARLYDIGRRKGAFVDAPSRPAAAIAYGMVEGAMRDWMSNPTPRRRIDLSTQLSLHMKRAFLIKAV